MVRELEQEQESYRSRLFHFRGMHENTGRHAKSLSIESASKLQEAALDEGVNVRNQGSRPPSDLPFSNRNDIKVTKSKLSKEEMAAHYQAREKQLLHDMEQMKERFTKLLLGEDMSGGGKGVSSALALSNAITNIAASIFGEQSRLEPMSAERKGRWRREIDWLLSVTDHIVELVPSQQKNKDGGNMEIMVTKQRLDLHMNIPALRTLDTMLLDCLDTFKDQNEFYYVSRDAPDSEKGNKRKDDKWWLPTVKVPPEGLSEKARKNLQNQKESVTQVLKAAMSINAQVLSEMEIPENYIESLPKNGRATLGDSIYRSITVEFFDTDQFLSSIDLSSEHKIVDLKNKIEASVVIWKRKMNQKDGKSAWGSAVSMEKRELLEERAETILYYIKHRFPGISQSTLDISKIQYNKDVGQALLESYSRILESLAFTILSRIEDVLSADFATRNPTQASCKWNPLKDDNQPPLILPSPRFHMETTNAKTLSDLLTWTLDQNDSEEKTDSIDDSSEEADHEKYIKKLSVATTGIKKVSYVESLGGLRSPTARH